MQFQFLSADNRIVYCDDNIVRITIPRVLFIKEEVYTINQADIKKCEIFENQICYIDGKPYRNIITFWLDDHTIWGVARISKRNLRIAEKMKNYFKQRNERLLREEKERVAEDKRRRTIRTYVAGTQYHKENVSRLFAVMRDSSSPYGGNTDSDIKEYQNSNERVYEVSGIEHEVYLEAEPDNEFDENAIAVYFEMGYEDYNIGYIPKAVAPTIVKFLDDIEAAVVRPIGGKYKYWNYEYSKSKEEDVKKIFIDSTDRGFDLIITFSKEIR